MQLLVVHVHDTVLRGCDATSVWSFVEKVDSPCSREMQAHGGRILRRHTEQHIVLRSCRAYSFEK